MYKHGDATTLGVTITTPDGAFSLIVGAEAVLASGWTDSVDRLMELIHPSLRSQVVEGDSRLLDQACQAVQAYYQGDYEAVSVIPVLQRSGIFRMKVWDVMRLIQVGEQISYAELARRAGNPTAWRAASGACSHNAAALFIPCHRIIRSDQTLGGFGFGLDVKQSLLEREANAIR